jgi:hypothetical protein
LYFKIHYFFFPALFEDYAYYLWLFSVSNGYLTQNQYAWSFCFVSPYLVIY